MNIEELREYCLLKPQVTEEFPFDDDTLVFKVAGKIFLLVGISGFSSFNVKCDPPLAVELREEFPEQVLPGYHMNKKHWNTVRVDGVLPDKKLQEFIDHSYQCVVKKLPKKLRDQLSV